MTARKSARDQLNRPGDTQLLLVMSGSDRDKLLRLVNSNAAPFFGSAISRMPELDRDFIVHIAELVERSYPRLAPVDVDTLWDAFQRLAHRPQPLLRVLGVVLSPLNSPAPGLFEQKDRFRPYDAEALTFYREKTGGRSLPRRPRPRSHPCARRRRRSCGSQPKASMRLTTPGCTSGLRSGAKRGRGCRTGRILASPKRTLSRRGKALISPGGCARPSAPLSVSRKGVAWPRRRLRGSRTSRAAHGGWHQSERAARRPKA